MSALPIIRGTSAALYPFTMTISFLTEISQWQNGAQKRLIKSAGLVKFALPYASLTQAQKNTILAFITSTKGRSNATLALTLDGTTYTNMCLDSDEWAATENPTTQYAGPIKLSQTIPQGLSPGTPGLSFPTLANGAMGVLPYSQKKRFQSVFQKVAAGPSYAFAEFGGGLTGYPGDGLPAWEFQEDGLTDADIATRVAHFIANYGRAYSFTFTDEDSTAYTKTHYASDDLVVTYRGVNDSSVTIALETTN